MSFDDEFDRLRRIRPNLEIRSRIIQLTRSFFLEQGFLEVDTPIRVPAVAPEQFITPIPSEDWFLSTSPELHMKRLLACGYDKLFQISRCFRRGEVGRLHNPEFTMLEWYRRDAGYEETVEETEGLFLSLSDRLGSGQRIRYQGIDIDLHTPWPRITVSDAFIHAAQWDPVAKPDEERFDLDLVTKVMPGFDSEMPTVLTGYPAAMASLARLNADDKRIAERAEVFIAGLELANAYSELNDAHEQRRRFESEAEVIRRAGGKANLSETFLEAVSHLPPCGGIALGIDRLVMLFCDTRSIQDVIPFPHE